MVIDSSIVDIFHCFILHMSEIQTTILILYLSGKELFIGVVSSCGWDLQTV